VTDPNKRLIVALLDRTGSMAAVRTDTEGAYDSFIVQQQELTEELGDDVYVTLAQFSSAVPTVVETVYEMRPLAKVPPLALSPSGFTPLHDAIGKTISDVGDKLRATPDADRPGKVMFVIMTDGLDNHSREFTLDGVRLLIEQQQRMWQWEFVFLGVGIDAFAVGGAYGIPEHNTVSVPADAAGVAAAYAGTQSLASAMRRNA